jgi:hypothetical protein
MLGEMRYVGTDIEPRTCEDNTDKGIFTLDRIGLAWYALYMMRHKTKAALAANIASILAPFKGRALNQMTHDGPVDISDGSILDVDVYNNRVHLTPNDIATIIATGLDERGYSVAARRWPAKVTSPDPNRKHTGTIGDAYKRQEAYDKRKRS